MNTCLFQTQKIVLRRLSLDRFHYRCLVSVNLRELACHSQDSTWSQFCILYPKPVARFLLSFVKCLHLVYCEQELLFLFLCFTEVNLPMIHFQWGLCYQIFSFICMFCRSLFVLLFFSFWSLHCLSFDLRILITPLVS